MKAAACLKSLLAAPVPDAGFAVLREAAGSRAQQLGLPGAKHEAWRLTDLSALYGREFAPLEGPSGIPQLDACLIRDALRIVFVDGHYAAELSDLAADDAVKVAPLGLEASALHVHFGTSMQDDVFAQLNARNFGDCAFVHVTGEAAKPIHVLYVATQHDAPAALYSRCLVVMAANARATLIEEYAGADGQYFDNAMTEVVLQAHAGLRHVRVQLEGEQAVHVGNTAVSLAQGANYDSTALSFGGRLSRHTLQVSHHGEGAQARLDGLILADGRQIMDTHTRIDHLVPNCVSLQRHKCIAGGNSNAVFSGDIVVHAGAKGTDTRQESRNLLLSGRARIDAQPMLEILNDDVSCKHGATVGQLDLEELFYLKSRGLSEEVSRQLLIYAFASEIVDRIPEAALVKRLRESMNGRLA